MGHLIYHSAGFVVCSPNEAQKGSLWSNAIVFALSARCELVLERGHAVVGPRYNEHKTNTAPSIFWLAADGVP